MANTHGFQVLTGVSANFLREFLRAAWKSGGKTLGEPIDSGTIPESLDLPPGTPFGGFVLSDGQIQIPKEQLDIALVAGIGAKITLGLKGHAHLQTIQNPAVPSLSLQDITADVEITAPIGPLEGPPHLPHEIGVQLKAAPKPVVKLTGPDPAARLDQLLGEQMQTMAAILPALPTAGNVAVVYRGVDAYSASELLQILSDPAHRIQLTRLPGAPPRLRLLLPVRFSMYGIAEQPAEPPPPQLQAFAVTAQLAVTALLEDDPVLAGGSQVRFNAPTTTVTAENLIPDGAVDHYLGNQLRLGAEFDTMVRAHIQRLGLNYLKQLGNLALSVPSVAAIEDGIASVIQDQLATMDYITIWAPQNTAGLPLAIDDVAIIVLPDALVLAINKGGSSDINAVTNMLPPGRDLAFVISADGVNTIFDTIKNTDHPFHRYHGDDHDFDLKSLSFSLKAGAIHVDGKMTVIDAILDTIDVDASFGVDIHLSWAANNAIQAKADKPDVDTDLSVIAWIITLIVGFVTAGGLGVIIAVVIDKIAESVAANIGTDIVKAPNFTAVAAWPGALPKIGNVEAHFDNPIDISPDGLVFSAKVAP